MKTPFRTAYGPRPISRILFHDADGNHDGRTEQCHKSLCDIHAIIRRHDQTGLLDHVNASQARYGDYTEVHEYQEALNLINTANASFSALPSHIRKRFSNDPNEYIEFVTNPDNLDEMVKLGMAKAPELPAVTKDQQKPVVKDDQPG